MDLTYLTASVEKNGDKVKESFKRVFDNIRVIEIEPTENLHRQVPAVEKQMRDMGSVRFDPDDFFVCDYDLRELGEVVARNRFNYAVARVPGNLEGRGGISLFPKIVPKGYSLNNLRLSHDLNLPFKGNQVPGLSFSLIH